MIESTIIARHGGAKYSYSRNSGRAEITATKRAGKGAAMLKFSDSVGGVGLESNSGAIWPNSRSLESNSGLNSTDSGRAEFDHVYVVKLSKIEAIHTFLTSMLYNLSIPKAPATVNS